MNFQCVLTFSERASPISCRVVTDPEEVNGFVNLPNEAKDLALHEMVLVKVKISRAEYFETGTTRQSWWKSAVSSVSTWFRNTNHYRPDVYSPAS